MEHNDLPSSPILSSSPAPMGLLSPSRASRKERRNPSVTPRRFGRFFTPRASQPINGRRILASLDACSVNRQPTPPTSSSHDAFSSDPIVPLSPCQEVRSSIRREDETRYQSTEPVIKRRKLHLTDDLDSPQLRLFHHARSFPSQEGTTPPLEHPDVLSDWRKATLNHFFKASRGQDPVLKDETAKIESASLTAQQKTEPQPPDNWRPRPVRKLANRGFLADVIGRELGMSCHRQVSRPAFDPREQTAAFHSNSTDKYVCRSYSGGEGNTIPFSLSSAHKGGVTAIGDDQGYVRLLKTTSGDNLGQVFNDDDPADDSDPNILTRWHIHSNAVMGLDFSEDDLRLATACGDRTGSIIDVKTGTVAVRLSGEHSNSLRQIAFQPGHSDTLITTDRDGCINVWDLRCGALPATTFTTDRFGVSRRDVALPPYSAPVRNSIEGAHERKTHGGISSASVTAARWFPSGREHLLLSGSEANACIKLWDTRYIKPRRQASPVPVAVTAAPPNHTKRDFGITSLSLSGDATRLYAVCKDNTVYAYSVPHLLLGEAPEFKDDIRRRPTGASGLGPMYGLKNSKFSAQTFYVKSALRPASGCSPELLAVGSSDSCPVLFPTDERYMRSAWASVAHHVDHQQPSPMPIYESGTPLIRGHTHEVSMLSWTAEGKLVTASDDYTVRCWQEDAGRARFLRTVGDYGIDRYMAGWADVTADWDTAEDEG